MPRYDTPDAIDVRLELSIGHVVAVASDRDSTVVEVTPSDPTSDADVQAAESTRVDMDDGHLSVRSSRLRSWLDRTGASVDVRLEVPTGSGLRGSLGMGEIHADGQFGECRLKTGIGRIRLEEATRVHIRSGAGDITLDRVSGHADVVAAAGDVSIRELRSTATIKNSNGATWVGTAEGEIRLHSANGDIAVEVAQAGVVARTANGDVRLEEVVQDAVVLETQVGDLEVGIREGSAAWLDLHARAGTVQNDLEVRDAPGPTAQTVEVRGRTSLGGIVVRRPRGAVRAR